jgi:hypothetical protein
MLIEFLRVSKNLIWGERNHTINNLYICIKVVPLSFEKSNQILIELMKFKEFDN